MALALCFLVIHALCTADMPTPVHGQESSTCWSSTLRRRRRRRSKWWLVQLTLISHERCLGKQVPVLYLHGEKILWAGHAAADKHDRKDYRVTGGPWIARNRRLSSTGGPRDTLFVNNGCLWYLYITVLQLTKLVWWLRVHVNNSSADSQTATFSYWDIIPLNKYSKTFWQLDWFRIKLNSN